MKDKKVDKFEAYLTMTPQVSSAKLIAVHPVKENIFCVYDKNEIQVIWLDKKDLRTVTSFRVFDNEEEIKAVVFSKDSLISVLDTTGNIKFYNYDIDESLRGSFHPYMNDDEKDSSPSKKSGSRADTMTTAIFMPKVELDHNANVKFKEFKEKRNLISQGTLITGRYKNSEFTIWDLNQLLEK